MPLRFTGQNPDLSSLERYPNWEYALDEEHVKDQDETTLRPCAAQDAIGPEVAFTAGIAKLADGRQLVAFLEVNAGRLSSVTVSENGLWTWSLSHIGAPARWTPVTFEWLPERERPPAVALEDRRVFPLRLESKIRDQAGTPALSTTIPA